MVPWAMYIRTKKEKYTILRIKDTLGLHFDINTYLIIIYFH